MTNRSGTNTRQRTHQVGVRLLPDEYDKLRRVAEHDNASPAEVLRRLFLHEEPHLFKVDRFDWATAPPIVDENKEQPNP